MPIDFISSNKIDFQPVKSQIQKPKPSLRTEVMAPIAHAASALAFDVPRTTMEMQRLRGEPGAEQAKEFLYPEQQTGLGKALRFGLEAPATVLGGAGRLATKAFTKMAPVAAKGMLGKVAQGTVSGATYGALQTKPTAEEYGKSLVQTTVGGAALPVAGKAISKVAPMVSGFGKTIVSKGAGLSKTAMDTVSRLGFKKVREVADKGVNYIQEDVIPRARQSLIKNITSAGEASKELLQDMGFNPDQIKGVMKISKQNMNKYGKMVSESWVKTEENLGKALTNVGKQIGDVYAKAAKEGQKVNIKNTIGTMRKQLKGLGVVDDAGNLLGDYKTHPSSAVRNLAQIYSEYAPRVGKGDISVPDFLNFRTRLQASIVKFPEGEKFNVPIYITNKVLKKDSINSLIQKGSPYEKFWRDLNKEYSDLETLDYLTKKITTVANNLPNKILTQRNKLTEKHLKLYGKDIVSDVDAYNAARELYPEKETFSVFNPQKPIIRGAYKGTEMLKGAVRPVTAPIGRTVQKAGQWGANRIQQYMEAPLVSPKTKSFFVQAPGQVGAKLKGKSGQAVFSREEPQKPVFGAKPQEPTPTPAEAVKQGMGAEEFIQSSNLVEKESIIPKTGSPFSFSYIRNTEKSPYRGSRFGQDVEPHGKYMTVGRAENIKDMPNMEHGAVRFDNPLVLEFGGGYGEETNWKIALSKKYGGKVGAELTKAIKKDGYDGIVTVSKSGKDLYTSEILDLGGKSIKTKSQLLSAYEKAKREQGKGTALGLAGMTAAGTMMAGQAQAEEKKNVLEGEVSTYGWDAKKEHLNERTANNEKFDPNELTAAMWDIPFGTKVKVTDKKTGKTVIVRINDRGPAKRLNRPIDLSRGAWKALGYEKPGLIQAKIEVLKTD